MSPEEDLEALLCAHTFHRECLQRWRRIAGKAPEECPNHCHKSAQLVEVETVPEQDEAGDLQAAADREAELAANLIV